MTSDTRRAPDALPAQKNGNGSHDGVLDSLGKAITDPVKTGAEDQELENAGTTPRRHLTTQCVSACALFRRDTQTRRRGAFLNDRVSG